ncbi:TMV resistance protein N-like [Castanea sativa]|uniref:TMV resistance protein N-like n=1 Tax=Castanea sativa TaxID=21020 RepID=UPI003F64CF4A
MTFLNSEEASFSSSSSSSSSTRRWNSDVFLSFRGEDTREGFTSHLYKALCVKGINTFIDDKLHRGEGISEELIQLIQNSSILAIFFSENFIGNFGKALAKHEKKLKDNKNEVQRWRDALRKAANTSGWHYKKGSVIVSCTTYKSESHFIQNIVEEMANAKVNRTQLYVAKYPVGINSRVEAVESLLDIGLDEF